MNRPGPVNGKTATRDDVCFRMKCGALWLAAALLGTVAGEATATNGYFSHGFGIKSQGMAGVGIALPQDALAAATNPAGMVDVGDRLDLGLSWARRHAGTTFDHYGPFVGDYDGNDTQNFFVPEFGYNRMIRPDMSLGVAVYANGGMNTDYGDLNSRTANAIFGNGAAGLDMAQVFIAPTLAMKLGSRHAVGVAPVFAYQRFSAKGLQNFDNPILSTSPGDVTNKGHDSSTGWGVHVGWIGEIVPNVSVGATYRSKMNMGNLDKYKGLLAEQGGLDIPANYGIGIVFRAMPKLTLAADVQKIEYSKVAAIGNSGNVAAQLGANNGLGFGWRDETIFKAGLSYDYSRQLTLRTGYSHGRQPIPGDQTLLNILAPVTVEDHLTLGATWMLDSGRELSLAYIHGFKKTVNGTGPSTGSNISLDGDILGIAYSWKM